MSLRANLGLPLPARIGFPVAYTLSLINAPILVAILGFWAFYIPVFALWFGAIPYLVLAGPGFALALRRFKPLTLTFALVGLGLNLFSPLVYAAILIALDHPVSLSAIAPFWQFGFLFAALWGAMFAVLYRALTRLLLAPVST